MALERGSLGKSTNFYSLTTGFDYNTGLTGSDAKGSGVYEEPSVNPMNNVDPRVEQAIAREGYEHSLKELRDEIQKILAEQGVQND